MTIELDVDNDDDDNCAAVVVGSVTHRRRRRRLFYVKTLKVEFLYSRHFFKRVFGTGKAEPL